MKHVIWALAFASCTTNVTAATQPAPPTQTLTPAVLAQYTLLQTTLNNGATGAELLQQIAMSIAKVFGSGIALTLCNIYSHEHFKSRPPTRNETALISFAQVTIGIGLYYLLDQLPILSTCSQSTPNLCALTTITSAWSSYASQLPAEFSNILTCAAQTLASNPNALTENQAAVIVASMLARCEAVLAAHSGSVNTPS